MDKKYTFFEINKEITRHSIGLQTQLVFYFLTSLLIRMAPIAVAGIIGFLANRQAASGAPQLETLLSALPISIFAIFATVKIGEWLLGLATRIYFIDIMITAGSLFCSRAFDALVLMPLEKIAVRSPDEWASLLNKRQDIINSFALCYYHLAPMLIELILIKAFVLLSGQYAISAIFFLSLAINLTVRLKASQPIEILLKKYFKAEANLGMRSYEFVSKIYLIKLFHSERFVSDLRKLRESEELDIYRKTKKIGQLIDSIQDSITILALIAIFYIGLASCEKGELAIGSFIALFTLVASGLSQFNNAAYTYSGIFSFISIAQTHMSVLEYSKNSTQRTEPSLESASISEQPPRATLEVRAIDFSYGERQVLKNVSFRMEHGEKIFLVGYSGSGKTTLMQLMLGLSKPASGQIDYGAGAGHGAFSYVPQSLDLFDDTLRNNLLIGNPNATDEQCRDCLKSINMLSKVDSMGGLEVNANQFSGGEKQRISIARALLSRKPIMLLDEPTSSLDVENERIIIDEISDCDISAIVSIHRIHSIPRNARCLVLDQGAIVQDGRLVDLIEQEGLLKKLWNTTEH